MNIKGFIIALLSLISIKSFAQDTLTGYAPDFVGKKVTLYTYQDYVTRTKLALGTGYVAEEDSLFKIPFKTNTTIQGVVEIDRTEGDLYLAPSTSYRIYFEQSEEPESYKNASTELYLLDLDSTDINYRILQYHQWFDMFIAYHQKEVARGSFLSYLDTFKIYTQEAYQDIKDPYFITYVRYDIAQMEQTFGGNASSEKRLKSFLNYIEPFPVYYENDRYMEFILGFYKKEFRDYLPKTEQEILQGIAQGSPALLMKALRRDIFLANPQLRELIMVDKLGRAFYREIDLQSNIVTILDSVSQNSRWAVNAAVAKNVKNYITNLEPGYPAPPLKVDIGEESMLEWSDFKGRYVYFNFFATWNKRSVREMEVIDNLVKKYGMDIEFLSLATDENKADFDAFMEKHPEYNWNIYYIGDQSDLLRAYSITDVPSYFLIDQEGYIAMSPALAPSPNGEYQSIDQILFNIQKALHPEEKIKVGEK